MVTTLQKKGNTTAHQGWQDGIGKWTHYVSYHLLTRE